MTETEPEQGLADRIEHLYASDPQFRAAAPLPQVTDAAHRPGLRLWEVVAEYLDGYLDRPALGQRACEVRHDAGRATTALLSGFDTITYRQLRERVAALSAAWQSRGCRPGDFAAVLGFTSIDYATVYLTCIRLGAVFVPLQTSSTPTQLAHRRRDGTARVRGEPRIAGERRRGSHRRAVGTAAGGVRLHQRRR